MRVCVRVFSVGFGPGLDSMSPARSRRSASHVAGTHGWLPQKTEESKTNVYFKMRLLGGP